jgi:hypothetical protein
MNLDAPRISPEEAERRAVAILAQASAGRQAKPVKAATEDASVLIARAAAAGASRPARERATFGDLMPGVVGLIVGIISLAVMPGASKIAAIGTGLAVYVFLANFALKRRLKDMQVKIDELTRQLERHETRA